MQGSRVAWKEAAWIFGLSRLVILLVSSIGIVLLPQAGQTLPDACRASFDPCFTAWYRWDAVAYVNIAHHGYTYLPDTAFFPFWPLLEHFGGLLLGNSFPNSYYFAGLIIAMLTRSSSMILAIPYLVVYIQRFWVVSERAQHNWREKLNALAPLVLIPAGVLPNVLLGSYYR